MTQRTLYVGCPMWAQRTWVGTFLPADTASGRELHAYSRLLNAAEGTPPSTQPPRRDLIDQFVSNAWDRESGRGA